MCSAVGLKLEKEEKEGCLGGCREKKRERERGGRETEREKELLSIYGEGTMLICYSSLHAFLNYD